MAIFLALIYIILLVEIPNAESIEEEYRIKSSIGVVLEKDFIKSQILLEETSGIKNIGSGIIIKSSSSSTNYYPDTYMIKILDNNNNEKWIQIEKELYNDIEENDIVIKDNYNSWMKK